MNMDINIHNNVDWQRCFCRP